MKMKGLHICVILLMSTKVHEAQDVGIHSSSTDLVSTWLREICSAESSEERSYNHNGATEFCTLRHKVCTHDIVSINLISLEGIYTFVVTRNFHAHAFKKENEVFDIQDLRDIGNLHLLLCKKYRTDDLQGLIFCTLRSDCTAELMPAFNYE